MPWSRIVVPLLLLLLASCATKDRDHKVLISVADQTLELYRKNVVVARYPISTSKYGLSDHPGSCGTPLGRLEIAKKIGDGSPLGTVFKSRRPTGEILKPDAPGRDPIVTRILWLKGMEPINRHSYGRFIYIHGTPEERNIGHPASFGCIRMKSADVLRLFNTVGLGAAVDIIPGRLPELPPGGPEPNTANPPTVAASGPTPAAVPAAQPTPSTTATAAASPEGGHAATR